MKTSHCYEAGFWEGCIKLVNLIPGFFFKDRTGVLRESMGLLGFFFSSFSFIHEPRRAQTRTLSGSIIHLVIFSAEAFGPCILGHV